MANLRQFMFTKEIEQGNPCLVPAQSPRRRKRTQPRAIRKMQEELKKGKTETICREDEEVYTPISVPCKQSVGFALHYATKFLTCVEQVESWLRLRKLQINLHFRSACTNFVRG